MAQLTINDELREVQVSGSKPLLWVLREDLALRGAKYSCGMGMCGACTVLVDGVATRSCVVPISAVEGKVIRTIEGLDDSLGEALKETWQQQRVAQCGYCQTGQIIAAYSLLSNREASGPLDDSEAPTNLCRCGTTNRVRAAIDTVAAQLTEGG